MIIRRCWADNPNANIGIACGVSGIFAVDVDTKNGKTGLESWAELAKSLGIPAASTLAVTTPTGGKHLYYTMPVGVRLGNSVGKLGEGLDTRGDAGYLVAPPSVIAGVPYRWDDESTPIAPCPLPLVKLLTSEELPAHPWLNQRITLAEILAFPPEPPQWIVEGLIEAGTLNIFYGRPGSLKSMLIADLVVCVAAGVPWMPPFTTKYDASEGKPPRTVRQCPAMWCDVDNGDRRTRERFRAIAKGHSVKDGDLVVYSFPPLDLANAESVTALRDAIVEHGAKLVVIDTFINATSVENESDNAQLRDTMVAARGLCNATGAAVILIHHSTKPSGRSATPSQHHDDLRGAGAIAAAADLIMRVTREKPDFPEIKVVSTKTRGSEIAPFSAKLEFERDLASGQLTSGKFLGTAYLPASAIADAEFENRVLRELGSDQSGPSNVTALRQALGCKNARLVAALQRLEIAGKVRRQKGVKGKVYELAG